MPRPAPAATFSADWLQQREAFDTAARDTAASRLALATRLQAWRPPGGAPLRVIDLACGTGANLRWLAPRLGGAQQWLVVDHDAGLLRRWPALLPGHTRPPAAGGDQGLPLLQLQGRGFEAQIVRRQLDLARALESLPWPAAQLVTGSALLDLVSAAWLQRLVSAVTAARGALLMALSVDGRHRWAPGDEDDAAVGALFEAHQQRDKGFHGPALGAAAAPALVAALRGSGYRVHSARSDWVLDGRRSATARALQSALVDGIAQAAGEQASEQASDWRGDKRASAHRVRAWQQRRQARVGQCVLRVGHLDVLALPPP